jgi:hypothetical protein
LKPSNIFILAVILVVLGGVYYWISHPEPQPPPEPLYFVWDIEPNDINYITISLPREQLSQSFINIAQGHEFPWFFDDPQRSPVDSERWGGGITLLLSGPGADRIICENATREQLGEFGLLQPGLEIRLTLADNTTLNITAGDSTPDGSNYYIRAPGTNAVATVVRSWYEVLERLVKEPPYAPES